MQFVVIVISALFAFVSPGTCAERFVFEHAPVKLDSARFLEVLRINGNATTVIRTTDCYMRSGQYHGQGHLVLVPWEHRSHLSNVATCQTGNANIILDETHGIPLFLVNASTVSTSAKVDLAPGRYILVFAGCSDGKEDDAWSDLSCTISTNSASIKDKLEPLFYGAFVLVYGILLFLWRLVKSKINPELLANTSARLSEIIILSLVMVLANLASYAADSRLKPAIWAVVFCVTAVTFGKMPMILVSLLGDNCSAVGHFFALMPGLCDAACACAVAFDLRLSRAKFYDLPKTQKLEMFRIGSFLLAFALCVWHCLQRTRQLVSFRRDSSGGYEMSLDVRVVNTAPVFGVYCGCGLGYVFFRCLAMPTNVSGYWVFNIFTDIVIPQSVHAGVIMGAVLATQKSADQQLSYQYLTVEEDPDEISEEYTCQVRAADAEKSTNHEISKRRYPSPTVYGLPNGGDLVEKYPSP